MNAPLYDTNILRLASTVPHLGRLAHPDGSAEKRSPLCGSRMTVDVTLSGDRVADIGLAVSACAFGQASANIMASHAIGRSVDELCSARDSLAAWLSGEGDLPTDWPGIEHLARVRPHAARHGAVRLPFETVAEAALAARR